jgi:phosphotransferase system enzyme I (PtsP)
VADLELVPAAIGCAWSEFERIASRAISHVAALTEMARVVANRLEVDVCSIYLVEDGTGDLTLGATMGLRQSSVGTIRMSPSQGLVGLVAQELQPVLVPDAPSHPRFLYFPEAGEDPYTSFFGVPILSSGTLRGVLVVQTAETRDLSADWAALATAAQRLAPYMQWSNVEVEC